MNTNVHLENSISIQRVLFSIIGIIVSNKILCCDFCGHHVKAFILNVVCR